MMADHAEEVPLGAEIVAWHWLRAHHERDALWVVTPILDLEAVGAALARDDAESVRSWLAAGSLRKPEEVELDSWNSDPLHPLRMVIVQPFVLVQEQTLN